MNVRDAKALRMATLHTPTDLKPKAVLDLSGALNILLADMFALYLKTKNFHWHVSGPHFRDYHLMLDEQAEQIFATTDPLAESVRKIGGAPLRPRTAGTRRDMLRERVSDNKKVAHAMRKCHELCEDRHDAATASLLEIYIDETER